MNTETFKGTIENAYGQALPTAVKYEGKFEAYSSFDELKAANDLPSNDEILAFINTKRKNNARQAAMNAALTAAGIVKPTLENDSDLQVKTMVKAMVASGKYNEEQATALAKQALGLA